MGIIVLHDGIIYSSVKIKTYSIFSRTIVFVVALAILNNYIIAFQAPDSGRSVRIVYYSVRYRVPRSFE